MKITLVMAMLFIAALAVGYLMTVAMTWIAVILFELAFKTNVSANIWALGGFIYVVWFLFFKRK